MSWSTSNNHPNPQLTTNTCTKALERFVRNPSLLAVATEASSHPSGVASLLAQPYVYSGGGLGNIPECPLQTCLAGGTSRDSITFAAVCIPADCTALDLSASDFCASLELVSEGVNDTEEYLMLHQRIAEVNKFLDTGWTCGEFYVPWNPWTAGSYVLIATIAILSAFIGTCIIPKRRNRGDSAMEVQLATQHHHDQIHQDDYQEEKKDQSFPSPAFEEHKDRPSTFWSAWDMSTHFDALFRQRQDTAVLDGLRVGSILWVMFGHVMAIQSSSAGGYNNPADFLPPNGFTTTWRGQLLFASRFAVDTFLFISGYLAVHVLSKLNIRTDSVWKRYFLTLPGLLVHRLLRILPLYGMTLGFYTQIAPHLGRGPFWYQWLGLLEPCREYGWTNWLFVNNFYPLDKPNTDTCFYHSWYLAVDVQLFLLAPLLVYTYRQNIRMGKIVTALLLGASIVTTMYLAWVRKWSLNTFDGAAVARFDVEAYAKPHVRAQAYLAGMLLSMKHQHRGRVGRTTWKHGVCMIVALLLLAVVTFGTVTGAYSRRPCRYTEWPMKDDCGSTWSQEATFWYTATSRAAWALAIGMIVDLCLRQHGGLIGDFLSLKLWTPLSHLSFGAYLIHPIVIFVCQLGNTQKETFRFLETGMSYVAVCVVSFGAALILTLVVEFPCASLTKYYLSRRYLTLSSDHNPKDLDVRHLLPKTSVASSHYGSLTYEENGMHHR